MELSIFTDGSSHPNPGKMGIGIVIYKEGRILKEISKCIGKGTNNIAEYKALIVALKEAKKLGATRVKIFSDSNLMVEQICGNSKTKNVNLKRLKGRVLQLSKSFDSFKLTYIPREKNELANKLSNKEFLVTFYKK